VHDTCPVCLELFQRGETVNVLACEHVLHNTCAMQWFTTGRAACPIDNIPVSSYPSRPPQQQPAPAPADVRQTGVRSDIGSHTMLNIDPNTHTRARPNQARPARAKPGRPSASTAERQRAKPFQPQMEDLLVVGGSVSAPPPQNSIPLRRIASGSGLGAVRQLRPTVHRNQSREPQHAHTLVGSTLGVEGRSV
jgi:hypothetical protein